jgi:hypothetical protein
MSCGRSRSDATSFDGHPPSLRTIHRSIARCRALSNVPGKRKKPARGGLHRGYWWRWAESNLVIPRSYDLAVARHFAPLPPFLPLSSANHRCERPLPTQRGRSSLSEADVERSAWGPSRRGAPRATRPPNPTSNARGRVVGSPSLERSCERVTNNPARSIPLRAGLVMSYVPVLRHRTVNPVGASTASARSRAA